MNLEAFKSAKLYLALLAAIGGVLLTQGVFVEGSTYAAVAGWILQVLGIGAGGAQLASKTEAGPEQPTA